MEQQIDIFDESLFKSTLTPRQWSLHNLLMSHDKLSHKEMLEILDFEYGYSQEIERKPKSAFNDLTCRRELTDDLDAIARDETIQTVLCGTYYARTEEEAESYIDRKKASLLNELSKLYIQEKKLKRNQNTRLVFKAEKPIWESTKEKR